MDCPERILEIVRECVEERLDDVHKAIKKANREVRKEKDFPLWRDDLVSSAIQDLVYSSRHAIKRQVKKEAGKYGGPAKVVSGSSKAVNQVALNVYNYCIAGTILGLVTGEQLPDIAKSERSIGKGHFFNADLAENLMPLVKGKKTVNQCVTEKKLRGIFKKLEAA